MSSGGEEHKEQNLKDHTEKRVCLWVCVCGGGVETSPGLDACKGFWVHRFASHWIRERERFNEEVIRIVKSWRKIKEQKNQEKPLEL